MLLQVALQVDAVDVVATVGASERVAFAGAGAGGGAPPRGGTAGVTSSVYVESMVSGQWYPVDAAVLVAQEANAKEARAVRARLRRGVRW